MEKEKKKSLSVVQRSSVLIVLYARNGKIMNHHLVKHWCVICIAVCLACWNRLVTSKWGTCHIIESVSFTSYKQNGHMIETKIPQKHWQWKMKQNSFFFLLLSLFVALPFSLIYSLWIPFLFCCVIKLSILWKIFSFLPIHSSIFIRSGRTKFIAFTFTFPSVSFSS